jgi:hypothetical protein
MSEPSFKESFDVGNDDVTFAQAIVKFVQDDMMKRMNAIVKCLKQFDKRLKKIEECQARVEKDAEKGEK